MNSNLNSNPTSKQIAINGINIKAELNSNAYSGLSGLLLNAPLLALANAPCSSGCHLSAKEVSLLQSCIEVSIDLLGDTLLALSRTYTHCDNSHEFITPHLLHELSATAGDLMPILHALSNTLQASIDPNKPD